MDNGIFLIIAAAAATAAGGLDLSDQTDVNAGIECVVEHPVQEWSSKFERGYIVAKVGNETLIITKHEMVACLENYKAAKINLMAIVAVVAAGSVACGVALSIAAIGR